MLQYVQKFVEKLYILRKSFLSKYWQVHYSQFGEDVVLKDWVRKDAKSGYYVDVGCYHPRKFSNTYFLYKRGWRGVNIDLDKAKIAVMDMVRPEDINIVAAVSDKIEEVPIYTDHKYSLCSTISAENLPSSYYSKDRITTNTLDNILSATKYGNQEIDLLSIDVEGHDYNVLLSLNINKYKPKIILVEIVDKKVINEILENDLYKFLTENGYVLVNWVRYTLFFFRKGKIDFIKPGAI